MVSAITSPRDTVVLIEDESLRTIRSNTTYGRGYIHVKFPRRVSRNHPPRYRPFTNYYTITQSVQTCPPRQFISRTRYRTAREMHADALVAGDRERVVCIIRHVQGCRRIRECRRGDQN